MTTTPVRRSAARALAPLLCAAALWAAPAPAAALPTTAPAGAPARPGTGHSVEVTARWAKAPGDQITYTLTAKNKGPSVARNVTATDRLPKGITFVDSSDGCTAVDQTVTCGPEPQLTVGQSRSWSFHARLSASYQGDGSDLGNSAQGASDATDPAPANNKPDPVLPPGPFDPISDLTTVKTPLGAGPTVPGQEFEYEIHTSNKGPSDARNVVVTDTLPDGLTFVSSADPCTAAGRKVTCGPLARMAPGGDVVWTFRVKLDPAYAGDGSDLRNTATSSSASEEPEPADNTSAPVLPPGGVTAPQADVWTTKRPANTTPIAPGETFEYVVTATNDGPSRAVGTTVTDRLPSQLAFVSSSPTDDCSAADGTVTCGPQSVLEPGTSRTYRFTVRLDSTYTGNGSDIRNTATATARTRDPKPENNTSSPAGLPGSTVNKPTADLAVTKEALGTKAPVPGETFDYRIRVTNNGPSADAFNVKLTDNLPEGLAYVASSPAGCTVAGRLVSCKRTSPLKVGETVEYLLTVRVDPGYKGDGSDLKNTAQVTADNIDPASENDEGTATVPGGHVAEPAADLAVVKKPVQSNPVAPGESFDYALTVTNNGPSQADQITVSDVLPTALSFVAGDATCTSGRTVTCGPLAHLAPGASFTWVIRVKLDPSYTGNGSDIRNTATVDSLTPDPKPANNTSTAAAPPGGTVKEATADLEVGKTTP
ncbi:hypothetical protein ACFXKW_07205 [Streptomyces sp. NPDC059193]|uniref:hypothetical protein n=1 Tax=Streptomyces sp. NPDC059193 TaxID=3346763 RepID=UPI0036B77F97